MDQELLDKGGVLFEQGGAVATVTLSRPDKRNAQDPDLWAALEPFYGLVPDLAGTKRLVELVGYSRALERVATACTLQADAVETALTELVKAVTTPLHGAIIGTKKVLQAAWGNDLLTQAQFEREIQVTRFRDLEKLFGS
jgi:enoyl-CoA hydratase/carnithine racemase